MTVAANVSNPPGGTREEARQAFEARLQGILLVCKDMPAKCWGRESLAGLLGESPYWPTPHDVKKALQPIRNRLKGAIERLEQIAEPKPALEPPPKIEPARAAPPMVPSGILPPWVGQGRVGEIAAAARERIGRLRSIGAVLDPKGKEAADADPDAEAQDSRARQLAALGIPAGAAKLLKPEELEAAYADRPSPRPPLRRAANDR